MAFPLSCPNKEKAVIGYLIRRGFEGVDNPERTQADAFTIPLCALIWDTALYLRRVGKTANGVNLAEVIEADVQVSNEAKAAAAAEGLPDWQTFFYTVDDIFSHIGTGGDLVAEYLIDITAAHGQRKSIEIARKLNDAEISPAKAAEALGEIAGAGVAQQIEPLLDARCISLAKKPPQPPLVFGLAGHKISTAGNLTVIAAQAKAGKTAALGAMLACLFSDPDAEGDFLGFEAAPANGKAVVLIDTEQSPFDAWQVMSRSMSRAGREQQPKNFRAFYTLDLSIHDRRRALQAELKRAEKICGGIHSIIIDGVADLCENVNDPKEANGLVDELVAIAVRYFCPVVCILHENPGNPQEAWKTRGHLGSQLERKAESNLRVKKNAEDVSVIYSERGCRHAEIPEPIAPRFKFCEQAGMHISCESTGVANAESKLVEMREEVEEVFNTPDAPAGFTWKEIHDRIMTVNGIVMSGARKRFDKLKAAGLIKKNAAKLYTR
jgi:hypothetical protein